MIDTFNQISKPMHQAIVAVEDKRFWSDPGVDIRGRSRGRWHPTSPADATQGASTITEQFVKSALAEEDNRTIFEKLREAALAFQLTHRWTPAKILTEYLNSIYFGNGAYGIESAARVYFGKQLGYDPDAPGDGNTKACGDSTAETPLPSCASRLNHWQAALLAGHGGQPERVRSRREPGSGKGAPRRRARRTCSSSATSTAGSTRLGINEPLPTRRPTSSSRSEPNAAPYFTSWLRPQILAAMGSAMVCRPGSPNTARTTAG